MKNENANSASNTGTTSTSAPKADAAKAPVAHAPAAIAAATVTHPAVKPEPAAHVKLSEADFLAKEATDAKTAIVNVAREMVGSVGHAIDPRPLMGKHPWIALTAAATAGFAGGVMATPSRQETAIKKLQTLSKALRAAMGEKIDNLKHTAESDKNGEHDAEHPAKPGLIAMLFSDVVKPAVTAMIAAGIRTSTTQPAPAAENGAAAATPGPAQGPSGG